MRLLAWAAVACGLAAGAWAAEDPGSARPEVLVLVSAPQNGVDRVAIAYAKPITEKEARADLSALLKLTHWPATDVVVDVEPPDGGKKRSDGVVEFTAPAVVPYPGGMLPVSPLVQALKHHRALLLVFQTDRPYRFDGPASYESSHLTIRLQQSPGIHRYDVSVRNVQFGDLHLPAVTKPGASPVGAAAGRKGPNPALVLALALGVAASVGVAVYLLTAGRSARVTDRPVAQR